MAGESLGCCRVSQVALKSAPRLSMPCDLPDQAIAEAAGGVRVEPPDKEASPEHNDARKQ